MPLRFQRSTKLFAILAVTAAVSATGCRQLGRRSAAPESSPGLPSAPQFSPSGNLGPALQEIPPMPPAAAKRSKIGGFSLPAAVRDADESLIIAPVAAESPAEDDLSALIPPAAVTLDDSELVPAPRDIDDDTIALDRAQLGDRPAVELDVAEFLAELEHVPAPVKALTVSADEMPAPQPIGRAIASPVAAYQNETQIEPWPPSGYPHGIAVSPGPTGTGNRVEMHSIPFWNHGRMAAPTLPVWGQTNHWAGPNSDWDGRQFR